MSGHVQHIIGASHNHVVAIGIAQGHVAGQIHAGDGAPVLGVPVRVAVDRAEEMGERVCDDQQPALIGLGDRLTLPIDDVHRCSRQRTSHSARLHGHGGGGAQARSAGLGLPPVVNDVTPVAVAADELVGPFQGLGIQRFAGASEESQRTEIVLERVFLAVAHEHA